MHYAVFFYFYLILCIIRLTYIAKLDILVFGATIAAI